MQFRNIRLFGLIVIAILLLHSKAFSQIIDDSLAILPDGPVPVLTVNHKAADTPKTTKKSVAQVNQIIQASAPAITVDTTKHDTLKTLSSPSIPKSFVPTKLSLAEYGIVFTDSQEFMQETHQAFVKKMQDEGLKLTKRIESFHKMENRTNDFFFLLAICMLLGIVRFADRRYFGNLWKAFWSPRLSSRQLKEQLQASYLPNFAMNMFFTLTTGAYLYYVVRFYTPRHSDKIAPITLVLILIGGMVVVYFVKYVTIKFTGWVFNVEGVTEQYLFNVFLINKILAVAILPIVILMAFVNQSFIQPVIIVSFLIIGLLLANRYIRSWQAFSSFLRYSKFHFFTYLCASEILPLAVLVKLLVLELQSY